MELESLGLQRLLQTASANVSDRIMGKAWETHIYSLCDESIDLYETCSFKRVLATSVYLPQLTSFMYWLGDCAAVWLRIASSERFFRNPLTTLAAARSFLGRSLEGNVEVSPSMGSTSAESEDAAVLEYLEHVFVGANHQLFAWLQRHPQLMLTPFHDWT